MRAASPPTKQYHISIPALPLSDALVRLALQAQLSISVPPTGANALRARPLAGTFTADEALRRLLAGTGFSYQFVDPASVRIFAAADQAPSTAAATHSTILVTATKLKAEPDQVPYSIDVLTGAQLARERLLDTEDVAANLAGVTITDLGPGRDKIIIRGMSDSPITGDAQSTVGIYLDDAPITYNAPDPDLMLVDVKRVEILRGPQGTLYGSGSIGGIYRIVTAKPDLSSYSGSLTLGGALTAHGAPNDELTGVVNLPLVSGKVALRAVTYRQELGGYIDDVGGPKNVNSLVRRGERISLKLAVSDGWTATAGYTEQSINAADSQYVTNGSSALTRREPLRERHDNDFTQGYLRIDGDLRWGEFTSTTSLLQHNIDSLYDATAALPYFSLASAAPAPFTDATAVNMLTQEMRLNSPEGSALRWLSGFFFSSTSAHHHGLLTVFPSAGNGSIGYLEDRRSRTADFALFGDLYLPIRSWLTLGAGLRWFAETQDVDSQVSQPPLNTARNLNGNLQTEGLAPKFDVTIRPSKSVMIYAQAAEGYRVGGFNTSGPVAQSFNTGSPGPQPDFRFGKDELWNYEAGTKLSFFNRRLRIHAAAFFDVWKNVQLEQLLPSGLTFVGNAGNAQNRGLELDASAEPTTGLELHAEIFLNNPELTSADPTFPAPNDVNLLGVAKISGGASISYTRALSPSLKAYLGASANYVGTSRFAFQQPAQRRMGGLVEAHLEAAISAGHWQLSAYVDNPADSSSNAFSYGNPFSLNAGNETTPMRPRTIGLAVSSFF